MEQQLDIGRFISLKKQELDDPNSDSVEKLEVSTQSIYRWLQYCEYHYAKILDTATEPNLRFDRISVYRRAGEAVSVRHVCEANIVAFLNSLHSLLDSFPYLLNLFIPVIEDPESTSIKWHENFIKKYKDMDFFDELVGLLMDDTFHKVKGYVNTTKHKHLIRISNQWNHLEFEEYSYRQPYRNAQGGIKFQCRIVAGENVVCFIEECHDELIPKLFNLCDSVVHFKSLELAKAL